MRERRKALSEAVPAGLGIRPLLPLAFGLLVISTGAAWAQDQAGPQANQPIQTAARARVPATPNQQRAVGAASGNPLSSLVSFEDGQLSINAADVSLADVLFAVRAATGADIDIPLNASSERITAQLGPGPARKVLADLLGWSSFDYIIQGSDDDPLAVHSITLMVRVKSAAPGTSPAVSASNAPRQPMTNRPEPESTPTATEVSVAESHPDQPAAAPPDNPDAPANSQPKVQPPVSQPWSGASSAAGKSPSEMIQELQQMYQQRRILQEQQNQASGQRTP